MLNSSLIFLILWPVITIFIVYMHRDVTARWAGIFGFAAGCGSFGLALRLFMEAYLKPYFSESLLQVLHVIATSFGSIHFYYLPFIGVMAVLNIGRFYSSRVRWILFLILLIPPTAIFLQSPFYPIYIYDNRVMLWCAKIYYFMAIILLIINYIRTKNDIQKAMARRTMLLYVPVMWWFSIIDYAEEGTYLSSSIDHFIYKTNTIWRLNLPFAIIVAIFILYMAQKRGILGIALKVEKRSLRRTFKAFSLGTSSFYESISNDVSQMQRWANEVRHDLSSDVTSQVLPKLENILQTAHRMQMISDQVKDKSTPIILNERKISIKELISQALVRVNGIETSRKIQLHIHIQQDVQVFVDPYHLQEVIYCVLKNAMEAVAVGCGMVTINVTREHKKVTILIHDNGSGISASHLPHVFYPFFTTKSNTESYGMSLHYYRSVMTKLGGSIQVESTMENEGTTIIMKIPIKRVNYRLRAYL